jgi:hypothetical protein
MFVAGQLAQSSVTSQQIVQASARFFEGARDSWLAKQSVVRRTQFRNLPSSTGNAPIGRRRRRIAFGRRPMLPTYLVASTAEQAQAAADAALQGGLSRCGRRGKVYQDLRAFFLAGGSMLVTHWSVNDQKSAFLVTDNLHRLNDPTGADWPRSCGSRSWS